MVHLKIKINYLRNFKRNYICFILIFILSLNAIFLNTLLTLTEIMFLIFLLLLSFNIEIFGDENLNKPGLTCYQCNIIQRQKEQTLRSCDPAKHEITTFTNCSVCAKISTVLAYDYRKPRFLLDVFYLTDLSKFCLRNFAPTWPNQCVTFYGSNTIQTRCFCDTNLCNSKIPVLISYFVIFLTSSSVLVQYLLV